MTYACHNRKPFNPFHHAQDGYYANSASRLQKLVDVPHVMTTDCQYTKTDLGKTDPKCEGCKHKEPV